MTAPHLGPPQEDLIVKWGERRKGVTVPEVALHFEVTHNVAWRTITRLVERGRLFRVDGYTRRREMLFGVDKAGRGATVYKARPTKLMEENDE